MMIRICVAAAVLLLLVLALLFFFFGGAGPPGEPALGPDSTESGDAAEPLAPAEVPEEELPAPVERGPGSILATVWKDGRPAAARVFVRPLRYTLLDTASCLLPPYNDEPTVAELDTDERGQARFTLLPLGSWEVTARGADGGVAWARTFCRASRPSTTARLDLLDGPHELRGRAVYADGRPFRGIVFAQSGNHGPQPQVETDSEGRFLLRGLPEGEIEVNFTELRRIRYMFGHVPVPAAGERLFVVDDILQTFRGRVIVDGTDEPVAGARISCNGSWSESGRADHLGFSPTRRIISVTTSAADGTFIYQLPTRKARFVVDAAPYPIVQITKPEISPSGEMIVRLKRRGRVTARVVRREGGTPVAGVRVLGLVPHGECTGITDDSGRAEGYAGPGRAQIWVEGGDWVSVELAGLADGPLAVELPPGETVEVTREVVPTARACGSLRDAAGDPAPGFGVSALAPAGTRPYRSFQPTVLVGPNGTFELTGLTPGIPWIFRASMGDRPPTESSALIAEPGGTLVVDLELPESRWLNVTVTDADTGDPISDVNLRVNQGRFRPTGTNTGADGRARVGPFGPGPVNLTWTHPDYRKVYGRNAVDITDPGEEYPLRLTRLYAVSGRIVAGTGKTFPGGMLTLHPEGGLPGGLGQCGGHRIQPEGEFRLGGVPRGRYDLVLRDDVRPGSKTLGRWTVTVPSEGQVLSLDPEFTDASPPPVTVRVLGPDDRPVKRGGLRLWIGTEPWSRFAWVRDGRSTFDPVPTGTELRIEILDVTDADGGPVGGAVAGPFTYAGEEIIVRLPAARGVTGRIEKPDGTPAPDFLVKLQRVLPSDLATRGSTTFALPWVRTAADGTFTLAGLGDGSYRILVEVPSPFALVPSPVVKAGMKDVRIRLVAGKTVTINVVDDEGRPVPSARATVTLPGLPGQSRVGNADPEGRIAIAGLDPSVACSLAVDVPGSTSAHLPAALTGWRPADRTIVLSAGVPVSGSVVGKPGLVLRARVWWKDVRGDWCVAQADQDGRFRVVVKPGGTVALRASEWGTVEREKAGPEVAVRPGTSDVKLSIE